MRNRFILISFSILLTLTSCSRVPITNRRQVRLLPESMLLSLSLTSYNQFLAQNQAMPASDPQTQLVRNTGGKISQAVSKYMRENGHSKRLKNFKWEFNLVNDPTVNAWCMPGGKVVIYTGILPVTADETGLAVVMGHEIAHAVARHGNERMSQQLAIALGGVSLQVAMQNKPKETQDIFLAVYGVGGVLGSLAYSRQHEYEADKMGMVFMAMAGYDPSKAIDFWQRMAAQSGGLHPPQFLSTHPSNENRIKMMKEFLPQAQKYYKPAGN